MRRDTPARSDDAPRAGDGGPEEPCGRGLGAFVANEVRRHDMAVTAACRTAG